MKSADKMSTMRTSERFETLKRKMEELRGAKNKSEYIRGLVLADAQRAGQDIHEHQIPNWANEIVPMSEQLMALAERMLQLRQAKDFGDYIQGLILLDAQQAGQDIYGPTIPGWIGKIIVEFVKKGSVKSTKSRPQEDESRGTLHAKGKHERND